MFRNDWRISRSRQFTNPTQRDPCIILFTNYFQESNNKQICFKLQVFKNWRQEFLIDKWTSFNELWNLTFFIFFQNFKPQVTFNDLETDLLWQVIWLSSFLRIIWDCQMSILRLSNVYFEFEWPWMTSKQVLLNSLYQQLHYSSCLDNNLNLTL